MTEEINVEELSSEQRQKLKEDLKKADQLKNWTGTHGIWSGFRALGKAYYNKKADEMSADDKKQQLKTDVEAFLSERF